MVQIGFDGPLIYLPHIARLIWHVRATRLVTVFLCLGH